MQFEEPQCRAFIEISGPVIRMVPTELEVGVRARARTTFMTTPTDQCQCSASSYSSVHVRVPKQKKRQLSLLKHNERRPMIVKVSIMMDFQH